MNDNLFDIIIRYGGTIWAAVVTIIYLRQQNQILRQDAKYDKRFDIVEDRVARDETKVASTAKRVDRLYDYLVFSDKPSKEKGYQVLFDENE